MTNFLFTSLHSNIAQSKAGLLLLVLLRSALSLGLASPSRNCNPLPCQVGADQGEATGRSLAAPEGGGEAQRSHKSPLRPCWAHTSPPVGRFPNGHCANTLSCCPAGLVPEAHWVSGEAGLAAHPVTGFLARQGSHGDTWEVALPGQQLECAVTHLGQRPWGTGMWWRALSGVHREGWTPGTSLLTLRG